MEFNLPPPKRFPDIYVVMNVIYSAGMFIIFFIYYNCKQITSNNNNDNDNDKSDNIIVDRKGKRKAE